MIVEKGECKPYHSGYEHVNFIINKYYLGLPYLTEDDVHINAVHILTHIVERALYKIEILEERVQELEFK